MNPITITAIEIYRFNIPFKVPIIVSLGTFEEAQSLLVRILTNQGDYGVGESAPIWSITGETQDTSLAAAKALAQLLLGKNPLEIEAREAEARHFLLHNSATHAAFDMALYDLLGKQACLPLYTLLGGQKRSIQTDITITIAEPAEMAEIAREYFHQGFREFKIKLGMGRESDVARVKEIRRAVGAEAILRVDANQGWDYPTACIVLHDLEPFDIQSCEQPLPYWDYTALKRLRSSCRIPIMADESLFDPHDAFRLACQEAVDYFNIKLAKCGGIHPALQINAIAEAAGIRCMVGCMFETRLALTASAHLAAARPNIAFADLDAVFTHAEDPVIGGITYHGGTINLPDAPGIGADIRPEVLSRMECAVVGG